MEPDEFARSTSYDWNRRGRHRLRAPAAVVIDLPVPAASDAHLWVATIWPDERTGGWARALWQPEPSPRIELREAAELTDADRAHIDDQLDRWDRASTAGPWTRHLLDLIEQHPGERSADLAGRLDLDQHVLKRRVRQLKNLGLTESLDTGYRLAPRGAAYSHPPGIAP